MPTLWDFDGIMGDADKLPKTFAPIHDTFVFQDLFKNQDFVELYVQTYNILSSFVYSRALFELNNFVNSEEGVSFAEAFEKDRLVWNNFYPMTFENAYAKCLKWFDERKTELDAAVRTLNVSTSLEKNITDHRIISDKNIYRINGVRADKSSKGVFIIDKQKIIRKD